MEQKNSNLPAAFVNRITEQLGPDSELFFSSLQQPVPVSVRYNERKCSLNSKHDRVPWCSSGFYLPQRPMFTLDPLFHAGAYYVQEASSMFLEQVVLQHGLHEKKISALDLCASPGGKTTHLASLLHPDSLIVSNEVIQSRTAALKENVIKWGSGNVVITQNDAADFAALSSFFDLLVIDAPCSGEGLFRKDTAAVDQWSEQNCALCSSRQKRILQDVLPCLKPGGLLVYSTCTYNRAENEENIQWLVNEKGMQPEELSIAAFDGVEEHAMNPGNGFAFYPHKVKGEGFFLAVMKKTEEEVQRRANDKRTSNFQKLPDEFKHLYEWVQPDAQLTLLNKLDWIWGMNTTWKNEIDRLYRNLHVLYAGVLLAEIKGKEAIPAHALSMYYKLNKTLFPVAELNEQEALNYLRRESVKTTATQKGWMFASFEGVPLGWLKNLGNRTNNYYPVEWRIRMR